MYVNIAVHVLVKIPGNKYVDTTVTRSENTVDKTHVTLLSSLG